MYGRILIAIAASTFVVATAYAQGAGPNPGTAPGGALGTPSGSSSQTTTPSPTTPSTPATGTMGTQSGSGTTMGSGSTTGAGSTGSGTMPNQAQSRPFNASNYKNKTDCLNAAQEAGASRDACNSLKQ